jgi:4-hydroxybenzoate polyprenyltransferase
VIAVRPIDFVLPVAVWLGALLAVAVGIARDFLRAPVAGRGKRIEVLSGLWTIGMYLSIGFVPLAWRLWVRQE